MKCLILGSNSFAGAATVDYLLSEGSTVIGVSRSNEPHSIFLPYKKNSNLSAFKFYRLDLNHQFDGIIELIQSFRPQYIIDFAGQGMVAESWIKPEEWYQTNIVSKVRLHNALKSYDFLEKYIRISTPEVYGDCEGFIDETASYNPSTPYAVSHAAIDLSLKAFHRQYSFPVIFTRFANFFGPGQQLYRIVPKTIFCALTKETLYLHGGGSSVRAFVHHFDVASGVFKTLMHGELGHTYHFSTDEFITIRELVENISHYLKVPMEKFVQISQERPGKDKVYRMNCLKAKEKLGWSPRYSLDDSIVQTIDWFKNNMKVIAELPKEYIHKP